MSKQTFKRYLDELENPKKTYRCKASNCHRHFTTPGGWREREMGNKNYKTCPYCHSKNIEKTTDETVEFKAPEGEKKCKICGMGSTKCLCKKTKVTPGPLNTTTFLEPGAVMSIKGV